MVVYSLVSQVDTSVIARPLLLVVSHLEMNPQTIQRKRKLLNRISLRSLLFPSIILLLLFAVIFYKIVIKSRMCECTRRDANFQIVLYKFQVVLWQTLTYLDDYEYNVSHRHRAFTPRTLLDSISLQPASPKYSEILNVSKRGRKRSSCARSYFESYEQSAVAI